MRTSAGTRVRASVKPSVQARDYPEPPPAVRGEKFFQRIDSLFAWLDGGISRWLPPELNPLAHAGAAANFALIVAVVTGVVMLVWYSPSVQFAYSSLAALQGRTLGGTVRALHRYSSDLAMLFLMVHAARVFIARKFAGARWLAWVSGVAMLACVWFIGWTGFWLVWDQPAQQVAISSIRLLDGLPIFGEPLGRLFVSDRTVPSLLFFVVFFLHMLLPLAIAVGLAVHLARISRVRLLPPRTVSVALLAGLTIAALLSPAPLDAPARMASKIGVFTADAWYLSPLALGLRFQHAGLWIALGGGIVLSALIPWLLGRRRPAATYQAAVETSRCHACTQCMKDCPFDAITMVPRTDGKRFAVQAQVDPARCVGCGVCAGSCDSEGIALTWFDTRVQEARLERDIEAGSSPWVALVAAEIATPLPELRGFQSQRVPTASWVRPKLLEHLFANGIRGVLVVRDARAEAAARDGGQWVAARLAGKRNPIFRPERAGAGVWRIADFDPSRPADLQRTAAAFRAEASNGLPSPRVNRFALGAALAAVIGLTLAAAIAPSHFRVHNPESARPELVLSLKALGQKMPAAALDPIAEAKKPVHMRGRSTAKPHRAEVIVRVSVDGVTNESTFAAKGVSHDGPAIGEFRRDLTAGEHHVEIEIITGPNEAPQRWAGQIRAEERHINAILFDPATGFTVE